MSTTVEAGHERIARAFAQARGPAALMPYMMGGFPTLEESLRIGEAYVAAGADIIELGFPYSDPLADGPVIQAAGTRALAAGTNVAGVLEIAARALAPRPGGGDVLRQHGLRPGRGGVRRAPAAQRRLGADRPRPAPRRLRPRWRRRASGSGSRWCRWWRRPRPPERLQRDRVLRAAASCTSVSVVGTTGERDRVQESAVELIADAKAARQRAGGARLRHLHARARRRGGRRRAPTG